MRVPSGRRRRVLALIACLAWILGVEGLPDLHLAHHENDHTHDATGAIVDHGHEHATVERVRELNQLAIDHPVAPPHDQGGLAHHSVALIATSLPAIAPAAQLVARVAAEHAPKQHRSLTIRQAARGPPAIA